MPQAAWEFALFYCNEFHKKFGLDIEIPSTPASDPLAVFEEGELYKNEGRFVAFILWLATQPNAGAWFKKLLVHHERRVWPLVWQVRNAYGCEEENQSLEN